MPFSHGRQARGGRNSGVKFRRQKHFRRHLSGNRIQAPASTSSVGRNLGVSRRPDRNLGVEFERQPNLGVNSSAPNLGAKFELQIRASGGGRNGDPDCRVSACYIYEPERQEVCLSGFLRTGDMPIYQNVQGKVVRQRHKSEQFHGERLADDLGAQA